MYLVLFSVVVQAAYCFQMSKNVVLERHGCTHCRYQQDL